LAFEQSVFINCPFDQEYSATLQAIAFTVIDLGFIPRLAPENSDNGVARLERILDLIRNSKFGIHDLSRCKSSNADEYYRLNMPFELGLDHSAARFGEGPLSSKSILILEETRYDYQKAISDISGWDIEPHDGDYKKAVTKVSRWLIRHAGADPIGPALILGHYLDFQGWYWKRETGLGASPADIREYPTIDVVQAMSEWFIAGRPL
jgi:hypothetical protein